MAEALKGAIEKRGIFISSGGFLEAMAAPSPTILSKLDTIYAGKLITYTHNLASLAQNNCNLRNKNNTKEICSIFPC
jgi:hypothetical protein